VDSWAGLLLADMEPLGTCSVGDTTTVPNMKICSYNVYSLNQYKLAIILSVMKVLSINVFVCIDTKHREYSNRAYTKQAQQVFGSGTRVVHSPIADHKALKRAKYLSSVGGQLIILSSPWAGSLVGHYHDPSNLGLVSVITLSMGKGQILILGNYWVFSAFITKEEQGLWTRTAKYLKQSRMNKVPHDYIKSIITGKA